MPSMSVHYMSVLTKCGYTAMSRCKKHFKLVGKLRNTVQALTRLPTLTYGVLLNLLVADRLNKGSRFYRPLICKESAESTSMKYLSKSLSFL